MRHYTNLKTDGFFDLDVKQNFQYFWNAELFCQNVCQKFSTLEGASFMRQLTNLKTNENSDLNLKRDFQYFWNAKLFS